jgi:hypothetical protein
MATRAPAVRKHLSADALFSRLRTGFSTIADHRPGTPKIPLPDALMSAFAMFSLKSPSLLSTQTEVLSSFRLFERQSDNRCQNV